MGRLGVLLEVLTLAGITMPQIEMQIRRMVDFNSRMVTMLHKDYGVPSPMD